MPVLFLEKLKEIPASNNVIRSRISDMSLNVLEQLFVDLKTNPIPFAIQLDESTDAVNCTVLLVYVRYLKGHVMREEMLLCEPLETTT